MASPHFNLIGEPWIRVRSAVGDVQEVSVRELLSDATTWVDLAGEIPSQDVAILRMLEAILLGSLRDEEERSEDECLALWSTLWQDKEFDMPRLEEYLDRVHDRFDLFHPDEPFLQVAGLTTASGNRSGLTKLIAEVPDGFQYFTTRAGRELEGISFAEAARWLVHCQAFDPSGIKSGAIGDARVKGGKGYPFGYPAWTGNLGLVVVQGSSLFETLLLNLPLTTSGPDDRPLWERVPVGPGADQSHPSPHGPADLFTWPSRRLRLFPEGERVVDVQVSNGDRLGPQNLHPFEPMSAWRHSKAQSTKSNPVLMPVTHDPARRIWQGLGALLTRHDTPSEGKRPETLEWLATLIDVGDLPRAFPLSLRAIGVEYGPQNSTIADILDDRLPAHAAALVDPVLVQTAVTAARMARDGVIALANLAGNLDRAAGGDGNAREHTFEVGYGLLDAPYRQWVTTLLDPERTSEALYAWGEVARPVLKGAGDELVLNAGQVALVGRAVGIPGTERTRQLDAGLAQRWFHAALFKAFPAPADPDKETA